MRADSGGRSCVYASRSHYGEGGPFFLDTSRARNNPVIRHRLFAAILVSFLASCSFVRLSWDVEALSRMSNSDLLSIGKVAYGEPFNADDSDFAHPNPEVGIWQPLQFLRTVKHGLFIWGPANDTTPVLFIHGAGGSPKDLIDLAGRLDRNRYQPWFAYYPSGLGLASSAYVLEEVLKQTTRRYNKAHVAIVAHSMGALLARRCILDLADQGRADVIKDFVSLAAPWAGHRGAALGVAHAPVVAPAWRDLATGSKFISSLFAAPLPPDLRYSLLYAVEDGTVPPNDGVVELDSALSAQAVASASVIRGFAGNHREILHSLAVLRELEHDLARGDDQHAVIELARDLP